MQACKAIIRVFLANNHQSPNNFTFAAGKLYIETKQINRLWCGYVSTIIVLRRDNCKYWIRYKSKYLLKLF